MTLHVAMAGGMTDVALTLIPIRARAASRMRIQWEVGRRASAGFVFTLENAAGHHANIELGRERSGDVIVGLADVGFDPISATILGFRER